MNPVAASAAVDQSSRKENRTKKNLHTDVLRYGEFVRGPTEILQPCGDKTPFHEGSPEKDGLGSCRLQYRKRRRSQLMCVV